MKKFIRSSNDLLLSILMGAVAAFLLTSQKIIIGVENGLGGMWAQASTYIHLLAGILLAMAILQLIYAIDFKGAAEHKKLHIPVSKEIVITAAALVLYALLLPVLTFFPCTLALNIVLCATFARKENEASEEMKGKLSKKQFLGIVIYSVVLTIVLWLLFLAGICNFLGKCRLSRICQGSLSVFQASYRYVKFISFRIAIHFT